MREAGDGTLFFPEPALRHKLDALSRKQRAQLAALCQNMMIFEPVTPAEIWDRIDLALIRNEFDKIFHLGAETVALNMQNVQCVPSGTFGQLCNHRDLGRDIILLSPTNMIKDQIWFGRSCKEHDLIPDAFTFAQPEHALPVPTKDPEYVEVEELGKNMPRAIAPASE